MILKTIIVFILIWITKKIYDLIDAVLEIECIFRSVGSRVSSILSLLEKEKKEKEEERRKEMNREKLKVLSDEEADRIKGKIKKLKQKFDENLQRENVKLAGKGGDKTSPTSKD